MLRFGEQVALRGARSLYISNDTEVESKGISSATMHRPAITKILETALTLLTTLTAFSNASSSTAMQPQLPLESRRTSLQ